MRTQSRAFKVDPNSIFRIVGAILCCILTHSAQAMASEQKTGTHGTAMKHAIANFSAMAAWEAVNPPSPNVRKVHHRPLTPLRRVSSGSLEFSQSEPPPAQTPGGPLSPATFVNFLGLDDNGTSIPPDTDGSVGPNHVVTALNTQVRIQNKIGTVISTVSLNGFWSPVLGNRGAFDPRCQYDPYANRWIMTSAADNNSQNSAILVAVSQTIDPTGNWNFYAISADPTNSTWADYDQLGFSKKWLTVTVNMFTSAGSYVGMQLYALNKQDFYNNGTGKYTLLTDSSGFALAPASTYDPNLDTAYFLEIWNGNFNNQGYLRMSSMTGNVGSETLNPGIFFPTVNSTWNEFDSGDYAPQSGSTNKISNGDWRMHNVVYRNGSLWCTHNVFLPTDNSTHTSVQWWQIDLSGNTQQLGRIDDPAGAIFRAFPSIAVNSNNDVLIGYSRFSASTFASGAYSFRLGTDSLNTTQSENILKSGEASYFKTFGGAENRWGDYSSTVVDPLDDLSMWTLQEYAALPSGGQDRFGTWWGEISAAASQTSITIPNFGFEAPVLAANSFQYKPSGASWTFVGGSGISTNASAFTAANPNAPEGKQVGILQGGANISQILSGFQSTSNYKVTLAAAQRGSNNATSQTFQIKIDDQVLGTFTPGSKNYADFTTNLFTPITGNHTLTVQGTNPNGGDNTAFLDNVRITGVSNGTSPITTSYLEIYSGSAMIGLTANFRAKMSVFLGQAISGRSITFSIDGTNIGSSTTDVNGFATLAYTVPPSLGVGVKTITATFAGDAQYSSGSRSGSFTVLPIIDGIGLGPVTSKAGKIMNAGARLITYYGAAIAGRNLDFSIDGVIVGSVITDSNGGARLVYLLPQETVFGSHNLTASFAGDSIYKVVLKTVILTVPLSNTSLTVSSQSGSPGQVKNLQCRLYNETGHVAVNRTVTFSVNSTAVGTAVTDALGYGNLAYKIPDNLGTGPKTIGVSFAGDTVYNPSTGTNTLTIAAANSLLYMVDTTINAGQSLRLPVRLLGASGNYIAGRTISLTVNGVSAGTTVTQANGVGAFTYTIPSGTGLGQFTITASFAGDSAYNSSTSSKTLTIK